MPVFNQMTIFSVHNIYDSHDSHWNEIMWMQNFTDNYSLSALYVSSHAQPLSNCQHFWEL